MFSAASVVACRLIVALAHPLCSPACLILDGLDPVDATVSEDRTAVVATKTNIVVAKDNTQVSAFPVGYGPSCVSRHPSKPEYAVGGKVSGCGRGGLLLALDAG